MSTVLRYQRWMVNVKSVKNPDDTYTFSCRKGLWSVTGSYLEAYQEAWHYFDQYDGDGEYD